MWLTVAGLNLLESAVVEAQCPDENGKELARQLYIHSLVYILRGLPDELNETEITCLKSAIPPSLYHSCLEQNPNDTSSHQGRSSKPSLLHRLLATSIIHLFLSFTIIVPYIKLFLHSAYKYERTHHLSERLFSASLSVIDQISKKAVGVVSMFLNSGSGRIGGIITAYCAWWIESISGGINEGVGEGLVIIGFRDDASYELKKYE